MTSMDPGERASIKTELAERLRELLVGRDAGNGTPLADAVVCAMMEDVCAAEASLAAVRTLGDQALLKTAENLHGHLHRGGRGFALPFGTKVDGLVVEIAGKRLMLDAGRPGLHPFQALRDDAHGPNLELLLRLLREGIRGSKFPMLGLPRPVTVDGLPDAPGLEFRPLAEVGGVTLRHSVSHSYVETFCSLNHDEVASLAEQIVFSVDRLWHERDIVGRRVGQVRRAVLAGIAEKYGTGSPVSLRSIGIDYTRDQNDDMPYLYVEYDSLDHALRPGSVVQDVHGRQRLNRKTFHIDDAYGYRSRQRDELEAQGASGCVDGLAADLIRAAPEGERAVLERLARDLETRVTIPGASGDLHGSLWWSGGIVQATFELAGKVMTSFKGVEYRQALPQTVMTAAVGRRLHEVAELPFRCERRIEGVERVDRNGTTWTKFVLEETTCPVDQATGMLTR